MKAAQKCLTTTSPSWARIVYTLLIVKADAPWRTVQFVAAARALRNPGKLRVGSPGARARSAT